MPQRQPNKRKSRRLYERHQEFDGSSFLLPPSLLLMDRLTTTPPPLDMFYLPDYDDQGNLGHDYCKVLRTGS
ncbi:hypothetical protein N665_0112s0008 [Sinapis alba]|nr:hypothetical protein N665_0112s0008 [Sinapis alba]